MDETGSIYVYGLTATQVAKNDKSVESLGLKAGDVVTLIGTRAEYKGTPQVGGPAYYMTRGLKCRPMAILFCLLTVLTFGFSGMLTKLLRKGGDGNG